MNRRDRTLLACLAVGSVLLPLLLAAVLDWPQWTVIPAAVPLLGGTALVGKELRNRRQYERLRARIAERPAEPAAANPEAIDDAQLPGVPVPSAEPDYDFLLSATIRWTRIPDGTGVRVENPPDVMRNLVLSHAGQLTRALPPGNPLLAQHRLAAELGVRRADGSGQFEYWAEQVAVTLAAEDADRLRTLATLRKDREVWEQQRRFEIDKREYLRSDALRTPGSAVIWQLAKDPDKVAETVGLIGPLTELSAAANEADLVDLWRRTGPADHAPGDELSSGGVPELFPPADPAAESGPRSIPAARSGSDDGGTGHA